MSRQADRHQPPIARRLEPNDAARAVEPELVGRTFDDFLFRPQLGVVDSRRDVKLSCRLSRRLALELPVISANMDSVTGDTMARTMALEGGLGIVHRAQSIEAEADQVRRVKRSQGFVVERPITLPRDATIAEAREAARRHHITSLMIEETRGSDVLAGLLTNRDMPWSEGSESHRVDEFMTPFERLHTAAPGIPIEEAERRMFEQRVERLPLVDDGRRIRGLITRRDLMLARERPHSTKDARGRLCVGAAIGARGDFLERAAALVEAGADLLLIDIAHAHSEVMARAVAAVRRDLGDVELLAGNVGTAEGALHLRDLGVDGIKVGIGSGRGCRTRLETAAGVPQLQAIREAWCAVGEDLPIVADGGIRHDKDVFLALVCGASTVMLGSLLSGTDEAPGVLIEDPATHQKHKLYRGMTSPQAVLGAAWEVGDGDPEQALEVPAEGQEIPLPYQGSVRDILRRIRGHLASAISYAGGRALEEVRAQVLRDPLRYLIPVSAAARDESFRR